jgi:serine/threonine-protein kinase
VAHAVHLRTGQEPYPGYHLRHLIGSGGFADVWAADAAGGRQVALKFLACSHGRNPQEEIRALQLIQQLHHPNLIRMERIWCLPGYLVVAMELADGSLRDLLDVCLREAGALPPPELICHFLRQAAEALDFLNTPRHLAGRRRLPIHHCDIKPSNLLLVGDTLKLADFGLAALKVSNGRRGAPAGTPGYAAPEVYEGRVSERTDQFALAVTYCELRGGRLPYPHPPPNFPRRYVPPPPDLSMLTPPELPIIARALSPLPTDRWPSCAAMMERLTGLFVRQKAAAELYQ